MQPFGAVAAQKRQPPRRRAAGNGKDPADSLLEQKKERKAMKEQQVPNSPYFIKFSRENPRLYS